MALFREPPLVANRKPGAGQWLPVAPTADRQVEESSKYILQTCQSLPAGGRALVLGAGGCSEVPVAQLAARFDEVWLNDLDPALLSTAVAALPIDTAERERIHFDYGDLTGVTQAFVAGVDRILEEGGSTDRQIEALSGFAASLTPAPYQLPERFELVVASCVLSQLHVAAVQQALAHIARRGLGEETPRAIETLRNDRRWTDAVYGLARRMEERFVTDLAALVAPDGRVYLSDTIQMCFIQPSPQSGWITEGTYRMTRTLDLADYIDSRFLVERLGEWPWVVSPPIRTGDVGRLFRVQALRLAPAR